MLEQEGQERLSRYQQKRLVTALRVALMKCLALELRERREKEYQLERLGREARDERERARALQPDEAGERKIGSSTAASAAHARAQELWRQALQLLEQAEGEKDLAALERARERFQEAGRGFHDAARQARDDFESERARLRRSLEELEAKHGQKRSALGRCLAPETTANLERLLQEAASALAGAQVDAGSERLAQADSSLAAALKRLDELRDSALEWRGKAGKLLERKRLPRSLESGWGGARKLLGDGEAALAREDFKAALEHCEDACRRLARLELEARTLTAGMVWVEGHVEGSKLGFWIDRQEVSVSDYATFLRNQDKLLRQPFAWEEQLAMPDLPVVGLTLEDARAYATWRGKSLPTRAMWKLAAWGLDAKPRAYPYGDAFAPELSNGEGNEDGYSGLAPARSMAPGASPWGCLNLSGNAAEWALPDAGEEGIAFLMGGSYRCGEPEHLRGDSAHAVAVWGAPGAQDKSRFEVAGCRCVLEAALVESGQ